ncbi:methyl-accepting chemotaxis protein [Rhizobium aquaticum]|uniref:Methyl-accepting chemotaxis protein n=1 Tax=Rhizobium aquaticum TaxID=1549636 RepID=A0ABV2IUL9_9HYPH
MKLSVSQRLWVSGVAAFVGIGSLVVVGWYSNSTVAGALSRSQVIDVIDKQINDLRFASEEIRLASMDVIIDRGGKTVSPERRAILEENTKLLKGGLGTVQSFVTSAGLKVDIGALGADIDKIVKAAGETLPQLVTSGAPDGDFDKIDDEIDEVGTRIKAVLDVVTKATSDAQIHEVDIAVDQSQKTLFLQFAIGAIAVLLASGLIAWQSRNIMLGLNAVRRSMNRIAEGDIATPVDGTARADEIGEIARVADILRKATVEKERAEAAARDARLSVDRERSENETERQRDEEEIRRCVTILAGGLARLAEGDLTQHIDDPFRADLERLRQDYNAAVTRLSSVIGNVTDQSSSIHASSVQIRTAADDLAKRTEQQAASLEETSSALEQITITMRSSTSKAEEAGAMVEGTKVQAEKSTAVVREAMQAMERIESASAEIGKIINVIDEIAFQTNLLALNAGVEAARAGDAGKGFAVVAQEVRELANRAAGAAKDIKQLVARSGAEVQTGAELVTATGQALRAIGADVVKINEHMISIVSAAREQNAGLAEINTAIGQMDHVTQQNAAMVEQTNAACQTLNEDTTRLENVISQFRTKLGIPAQTRSDRPAVHANTPIPPRAPVVSTGVKPAVAPAQPGQRPRTSPAQKLMGRLENAFGGSPAPARSTVQSSGQRASTQASPSTDQWEEF